MSEVFIRKKKNRSGTTSIIVAEKHKRCFKELHTLGVSAEESELERLVQQGKEWILDQSKEENKMKEYCYENGRRLLIGYTNTRARKDAYNREKGIRRLEKAYKKGSFRKSNLNKKGYNKFLEMKDQVQVSINHEKIEQEARWDGLKGYITNSTLPTEQIYEAYHNYGKWSEHFVLQSQR